MNIDTLNLICERAAQLKRTIDISMVQEDRGFALVFENNDVYGSDGKATLRNVYQDYAITEYNGCRIIDRYADNIKQLTDERFKRKTTDISFNIKKKLVESENSLYKDGFVLLDYHEASGTSRNLKGEFAWIRARGTLIVNVIKDNFNVDTLRQILLDSRDLIIDCNVPCYLDGPLFDDINCTITMKNLTLGPSALRSYNNYLIRNGIEYATLHNKLMYQDNLHLLTVKAISYSNCSHDLPILPLELEKLELSMQRLNAYTVAYLDKLNTLKLLCNKEFFLLKASELPALIDLEIHDMIDVSFVYINRTIINRVKTLTLANSRIKDIEFPNVTTLKGDLYPELFVRMPKVVNIVGYNINVLGDLVEYIPKSVETLRYDHSNDRSSVNVKSIIPYYKKVLELPKLREVTYIVGIDYPYDPLKKKNMVFDILIYYAGDLYSMINKYNRSYFENMFGDEIKAIRMHNKRNGKMEDN